MPEDIKIKYFNNFATLKDTKDNDIITAVASTASIDRDGEVIAPRAFEKSLESFVKNGSILACHQHRLPDGSPPMIGRPVGAKYVKDSLAVDFVLGKGELASKWRDAKEDGTWRNVSVGFIPMQGESKSVGDVSAYHHTEAELLELSGVPVGSNRDASLRGYNTDELLEKMGEVKEYINKLLSEIPAKLTNSNEVLLEELQEYINKLIIPDAGKYADILMSADDQHQGNNEKLNELCNCIKNIGSK